MSKGSGEILITGGAGFIGGHLADRLLESGSAVTAFDNFDRFYETKIKRENIAPHLNNPNYRVVEGDLRNSADLAKLFADREYDVVVHLAALAGVRPSVERPGEYMDVNVSGTQRLLDEMMRQKTKPKLIFASSSSVYGERDGGEFKEVDDTSRPMSPYGASKKAGEVLCHAAHHTTGLSAICLRFFTVYGPRQRPDLAINKFCRLIDDGKPIEVFGDGSTRRDYTFVADTVSGIIGSINYSQKVESVYEIVNLGRSEPVLLSDMIACIESSLGKRAIIDRKPLQTGDVPYTCANVDKARQLFGYDPKVSLAEGIEQFVSWYKSRIARAGQTV